MSDTGGPRPASGTGQPRKPAHRLAIAFVVPPWFDVPPRAYGGIEAMAASLIEALIDRGHEVVLIGAGNNGTRARFLRTHDTALSSRIGETLPEMLHAARSNRHLDRLDVDIVHDHSLAGPLSARGRRIPTVVTAHGPSTGEIGTYYRNVCSDVHLVAISGSQQRIAAGEIRWAAMVYNAITTADFRFRGEKDDYVLFLGRFSPEKGAHLAIDAARSVGRPILLAGKLQEPKERAYFEAEVRPRLASDAQFVGEVDMIGKQELYAAAHCLLFPIRWEEPFGMVMIEAMACGTPVVALRRGSVPEIVTDGVTGFIRDHPSELAAAINQAGEIDPAACRRHVEKHFDVSIMAAGYESVYAAL
jgi:glycosyltransferase involved in cell wall biosynthesis